MTELKDIDFALAEILLDNIVGKKGKLTYAEATAILTEKLGSSQELFVWHSGTNPCGGNSSTHRP